ncbi:MAG: hypothetical protein GXP60_04920 [Epsilonproteobacteria bacterium]|nr:hypothetical protein [Campylobacterota bacterium]
MKNKVIFMSFGILIFFSAFTYAAGRKIVPGDIIFTAPVKSVIFSHEVHVNKEHIDCNICHSTIFDTKALNLQKNKNFNMKSLCKGRYCGVCHNGEIAFSVKTQCARCHIGVRGFERSDRAVKIPRMSSFMPKNALKFGTGNFEAVFSHKKHIGVHCNNCHTKIFPFKYTVGSITMNAIKNGQYCGKCHNGKIAFSAINCLICHNKLSKKNRHTAKD